MSPPLLLMYLLSVAIGAASYLVSRGPDGNFAAFLAAFGLILIAYVTLAWLTRHQPIWLHIGAHLLLFLGVAALGMMPKPRLSEMAGMLYLFLPAAIVVTILLGCLARLLARWT